MASAWTQRRQALDAEYIGLEPLPGSEYHLVPELIDALAAGTALTLGDFDRAVLVELPVHTIPLGSEDLLEQILAQGLVPIIAHPERNSELARHPERLADWVAMGCMAQLAAWTGPPAVADPTARSSSGTEPGPRKFGSSIWPHSGRQAGVYAWRNRAINLNPVTKCFRVIVVCLCILRIARAIAELTVRVWRSSGKVGAGCSGATAVDG